MISQKDASLGVLSKKNKPFKDKERTKVRKHKEVFEDESQTFSKAYLQGLQSNQAQRTRYGYLQGPQA